MSSLVSSNNRLEYDKEMKGGNSMTDNAKQITGYCVKCKAKKSITEAKETTMKNGRKAMKGKCLDCGTGMFRILGK